MTRVSEVALKYSAKGARAAQRADRNVRQSIEKTSRTARKESGSINRWMEAHRTALLAIGAATAVAMGYIINNSPTLSAELSTVRLAFSLLAFELGESLAPAFRGIGDLALKAVDWFSNLPQPIKDAVAMFIALTAAIVPLIVLGAGLAAAIAAVGTSIAVAAGVALVAGLAIAGIAALIYAAYKSNFLGFRDIVDSVLAKVESFITGFVQFVRPYWNNFIKAVLEGRWGDAWETVKRLVQAAIPIIQRHVQRLVTRLVALYKKFQALKRTIWETIWDFAVNITKRGGNRVLSEIESFVNRAIDALNMLPGFDLGPVSIGRLKVESTDEILDRAGRRLQDRFGRITAAEQDALRVLNPDESYIGNGMQPLAQDGGGGTTNNYYTTVEAGAVQMNGSDSAPLSTGRDVGESIGDRIGDVYGSRR